MRYILRIVNAILDTCLAWFTPLWRRRAHETLSAITRYVRHYRPDIKSDKMAELNELQTGLKEALLFWRREDACRLAEQTQTVAGSLPGFRRNVLVELLESLFVITVVFLGVRTYFVQPFRIPTNSMWPSLNGIVVHEVDSIPALPKRVWDKLTLGSSYVDVKADGVKRIVDWKDKRKWLLFSVTKLKFDDGDVLEIPAASGTIIQYLRQQNKVINTTQGLLFLPYRPGETIMRARVDAGDMVLVNRMAYHFRRPRRGETFVFDTRGINTGSSSSHKEQSGGTHFIKRLTGLPGDTIGIDSPQLVVNGQPAAEPGIVRVAEGKPPYGPVGYVALDPLMNLGAYLCKGRSVTLSPGAPGKPWLKEYLALGDNTEHSLDSRYWGPVREFNVLGPAFMVLWPFTWHWGAID